VEPKEEYSFRVDPRWRWEDTGRIIIGSQDKLSNQLAENAHNIISDLLDKLGVSLLATVADKTANERINQLINHATVSGDLNSQKFSRVFLTRIKFNLLMMGIQRNHRFGELQIQAGML
jgi:hypothetical protein